MASTVTAMLSCAVAVLHKSDITVKTIHHMYADFNISVFMTVPLSASPMVVERISASTPYLITADL